jgi:hypothetical protein
VDPLRESDIELARATEPAEKLRQALELMELGFRLKRAALRERHPNASDAEIQALFRQWLVADE